VAFTNWFSVNLLLQLLLLFSCGIESFFVLHLRCLGWMQTSWNKLQSHLRSLLGQILYELPGEIWYWQKDQLLRRSHATLHILLNYFWSCKITPL